MCLLHDVNALITYFTSISYLSIKDLARTIIKSLTESLYGYLQKALERYFANQIH
jgi:hypothetical protein